MYKVFERLINERGITPYKVSKDTGITQTSLSKWKLGKTDLSRASYEKLAKYFGVSIDYLMTGVEPDAPSYYLDDDARDIAQFLFENPDYKVLFDASRKVKREDIEFIRQLIDRASR